jgi:hypothetical protein
MVKKCRFDTYRAVVVRAERNGVFILEGYLTRQCDDPACRREIRIAISTAAVNDPRSGIARSDYICQLACGHSEAMLAVQ